MPIEEISLKVDEDIAINIQQEIGENLTVKQNTYAFDASLGEYGGYRIYLD
ncbi:hypothetical protein [Epilithonimonas sp.]|uniref:hypothetical protein n=1 Tax=Epilithonimonas sp. TaxID=2894511 RepID=UPI00289E33B0|nr:hypothetical protein [Epilithonimonas sp.]